MMFVPSVSQMVVIETAMIAIVGWMSQSGPWTMASDRTSRADHRITSRHRKAIFLLRRGSRDRDTWTDAQVRRPGGRRRSLSDHRSGHGLWLSRTERGGEDHDRPNAGRPHRADGWRRDRRGAHARSRRYGAARVGWDPYRTARPL